MIEFNDIRLSCSSVGLFSTKDSWVHPTVSTKTHEIMYVISGTFDIIVGDKMFSLKPKDVLIMPANVVHGGTQKTPNGTEIKFYWVHFYCDDTALKSLFTTTLYSMNEVGGDFMFRELMHLQRGGETQILTDIKLAELLMRLHINANARDKQTKLVGEIKAYIHVNADRRLTVQDISEVFNYNKSYISRLFTENVGISMKEFIIEERINYTKSYLLNTTFPINVVAHHCGFEDGNQFVKFFKYNAGLTPTQYRNKHNVVHINKH